MVKLFLWPVSRLLAKDSHCLDEKLGMRLLLCFILIFYSSLSWSDCKISNGRNLVTIPESKAVSLFENGKSLSTHKTQDQDGLGTCYANSTSVVLKSVLPTHPDISYTHAALMKSTRGWSAQTDLEKRKYVIKSDKDEVDITAGGFVCETIAAMKKAGGACAKKNASIENKENLSPDIQQKVMLSLGKYFDKVNEFKNNPTKLENFKKDLATTINSLRLENAKLVESCEAAKKENFPLTEAVKNLLIPSVGQLLGNEEPCAVYRLNSIKNILVKETNFKADRVFIHPSPEIISKLVKMIESDPSLASELSQGIKENKPINDPEVLSKLKTKINDFLVEAIPEEEGAVCPRVIEGKSFVFNEGENHERDFIDKIREEKNKTCTNLLVAEGQEQFNSLIDKNQCIDPASVSLMTSAIAPLLDLGMQLDEALVSSLNNTMAKNGEQLVNILAPSCLDKDNLINLDKVSCSSFSTCDESMYINLTNNVYNGPVEGCYDMPSAKTIARMQTFNAIEAGRSLGISVCTSFLEDPTVKTDFCRKAGKGVEGHSFHSMAVSGYRCQGGKIEYEILNSWGSYCPVAEGKTKNSAFDCVLDKAGSPTGRFWVKEDVLIDSTTELNSVTVRK